MFLPKALLFSPPTFWQRSRGQDLLLAFMLTSGFLSSMTSEPTATECDLFLGGPRCHVVFLH